MKPRKDWRNGERIQSLGQVARGMGNLKPLAPESGGEIAGCRGGTIDM